MMQVLKNEQGCLMGGLKCDLKTIAKTSLQLAQEMVRSSFHLIIVPILNFEKGRQGTTSAEAPSMAPTGPAAKLATFEKNLSTLQLSLEILSGWCATLDAAAIGGLSMEDEEWGGIAQEDNDDDEMDDVDMDNENDKNEDDEEDAMMGIEKKRSNDTPENGDDELQEEDDEDDMGMELTSEALQLASSLPQLLLALALPTSISYLHPAAIPSSSTAATAHFLPDLIPTAAAGATTSTVSTTPDLPLPLVGIADIITTIHVRALECLNNLYITLARSASFLDEAKNASVLQHVWAGTMELVLSASVVVDGGKEKEKKGEENGEERKMEMMMAGTGACWGMARVGLRDEGPLVRFLSCFSFLPLSSFQ